MNCKELTSSSAAQWYLKASLRNWNLCWSLTIISRQLCGSCSKDDAISANERRWSSSERRALWKQTKRSIGASKIRKRERMSTESFTITSFSSSSSSISDKEGSPPPINSENVGGSNHHQRGRREREREKKREVVSEEMHWIYLCEFALVL